VTAGAGGREATPLRLHASVTYGVLGMDSYAFGAEAPTLQRALARCASHDDPARNGHRTHP